MPDTALKAALNVRLPGIASSPGIAIGKAYLVEGGAIDVIEKRFVEPEEIRAEVKRFKKAVKKARTQLQGVIEQVPDEYRDHIYILDAHMMLLKDRMIYDGTIKHIEQENLNA